MLKTYSDYFGPAETEKRHTMEMSEEKKKLI